MPTLEEVIAEKVGAALAGVLSPVVVLALGRLVEEVEGLRGDLRGKNFGPVLTVSDAAAFFQVDRKTIDGWRREGMLGYSQIGGVIRIRRAACEALLAGMAVGGDPHPALSQGERGSAAGGGRVDDICNEIHDLQRVSGG